MPVKRPIQLNLIAAACENMGIGNKGDLPWRLKNEMAYFNRMTTMTDEQGAQNAVIMGRKTWFSIPPHFRPLANRINIVISRELSSTPEGAHYLFNSLDSAIDLLQQDDLRSKIQNVWVIGGSAIYKEAMNSDYCHRIYMTKVMSTFECDTFFPAIDLARFKLVSDPNVPEEIQEEKGIKYQFNVYEVNKS